MSYKNWERVEEYRENIYRAVDTETGQVVYFSEARYKTELLYAELRDQGVSELVILKIDEVIDINRSDAANEQYLSY